MSNPDTPPAVTVINVFTAKPDRLEEFVAVQRAALPGFPERIPGLRGSRLYRCRDGIHAALVSTFESAEHHRRFRESDEFAGHRARLAPLLERAEPAVYELVYESGRL